MGGGTPRERPVFAAAPPDGCLSRFGQPRTVARFLLLPVARPDQPDP